jgi:ATP/maltotriose-dependent transcriptional regulator MalT
MGYAYTQPNVMAALGEARLLAGQTAAAGAIASDAVEVARRQKQRGYEAWALRVQGNIALADGAPGDAELRFREAIALAGPRDMRPLLAHCRLGLGEVARQRGDAVAAREAVAAALVEYRAMAMPYWIARAETELLKVG